MNTPTGRDAIRWPGLNPLGALPDMQRSLLDVLVRARFELGEVVNLRLPTGTFLATATASIAEQVLVAQVSKFTKDTLAYDQLRRVLGNGLVTSEGSFWLRQRRLAQPAFHREHLQGWGAVMVKATRDMLDTWQPRLGSGVPFAVMTDLMKLTLRIVGETLLSADVTRDAATVAGALESSLDVIQHAMMHPLSAPVWVPTKMNRDFVSRNKALDQVVYDIIAERRGGGGPQDDLLALLMNATDAETGERMNDEQLRDEVMTIFLAGHETTAVLLSWAVFLLSKHPDVERHLRTELKTVLGGREVTTADVPRLPYLGRVIKEVLRLYPPAWVMSRRVTEDLVIDGWQFPKQAVVMISSYVLHRLPTTFPNPEGFDPDRWLDEEKLPRSAYIPFSVGSRKCIGDSFAQLEAALILATMVPRVQLSLVPGQTIVPEPLVTLRPSGGVQVTAVSAS